MNKSDKFRVINTSSIGHKRVKGFLGQVGLDFENMSFEEIKFDYDLAYGRSKIYINLATHALAEKAGKRGIVVSLHPGVARSGIIKNLHSGADTDSILLLELLGVVAGHKKL